MYVEIPAQNCQNKLNFEFTSFHPHYFYSNKCISFIYFSLCYVINLVFCKQ